VGAIFNKGFADFIFTPNSTISNLSLSALSGKTVLVTTEEEGKEGKEGKIILQ
jgi:hypothetical protein